MNQTPRPVRAAALLTVLMLLLAACGGGATADEPAAIPPNDNPANTPAAGGTCLEGEPDCNDTPAGGGALPLPNEDEPSDAVTGGMPVDGGLTVSEALESDATGVIAVRGFLVADQTGARLCEVLAESYPPQCGGAGLPVSGYEEILDVPTSTAQGVTWTDQPISLLGEIVDGTLLVDPTVAG
ncbi:MAG: hypothetical protein RI637_06145 [Acidimicrobiia bacterium]|nr:hypothetical protein [Acidimicrobiia bacterium]